jgi:hypothetical protein
MRIPWHVCVGDITSYFGGWAVSQEIPISQQKEQTQLN